MHIIYFNKTKVEVPSGFDELTRGQVLRVMGVMHEECSFKDKVAAYTLILLDIPRKWKRAWYWLFRIGDDAKIDIGQTTEFLFKEPNLTQNKFPHIKINQTLRRSVHLYGPKDKLNNIVFMEFVKAETYYVAYHKHLKAKDHHLADHALNMLVAVLYRPKRRDIDMETFNGDYRVLYNDDRLSFFCGYTEQLSMPVKQAILLFYLSCRAKMIKPFKHLYPKMPETNEESGSSKGADWLSAIYAIAGGALKMQEVSMVDARLALYDLDRKIAQQEKMEKDRESLKNK